LANLPNRLNNLFDHWMLASIPIPNYQKIENKFTQMPSSLRHAR
jgi:hypothetical protein